MILSTLANVFSKFFTVCPKFTFAKESDIVAKFPDTLSTFLSVLFNLDLFSARISFMCFDATLNSDNVVFSEAILLLRF